MMEFAVESGRYQILVCDNIDENRIGIEWEIYELVRKLQ